MKKLAAVLTVLAICAVIGGSTLGTHGTPVAEHGIAPGMDAITAL